MGCLSNLLFAQKKKSKISQKREYDGKVKRKENHQIKVEDERNYTSTEMGFRGALSKKKEQFESHPKSHPSDAKVDAGDAKKERSVENEKPTEAAYDGGDEHDDTLSMKRDFSYFDLQEAAMKGGELNLHDSNHEFGSIELTVSSKVNELSLDHDLIHSGNVSDPGAGRPTSARGTHTLKRSCSNIETKRIHKLLGPPKRFLSYHDLKTFSHNSETEAVDGDPGTPASAMTSRSADKVMLKKKSSSQVLPSRSRKVWWKLFLWSHRNLHQPLSPRLKRIASGHATSNTKSGYCSDTIETGCRGSDLKMKRAVEEPETGGSRTVSRPEYQWLAFAAAGPSSLARVSAWVHSLEDGSIDDARNSETENTSAGAIPNYKSTCAEVGESSGKNNQRSKLMEDVIQANRIIESMNVLSTVAHIANMGLKVMPTISAYSSLRRVYLSGNLIEHISPSSLPKNLHTLDLSRNKITAIEGLRELTRLRVLNLSYNKISRIGHGLSNCTIIKELYLAGNKISEVEGLHRLPKLTVLDLSFNKIATTKALGQLVANYNSLLAVNLVGNPVHTNTGDAQLRKAVTGLLPQLAYLNKQPVNPQRARELMTENYDVAKAALGDRSWSSPRRTTRSSSFKNKNRGITTTKAGQGKEVVHSRYRRKEGSSSFKIRSKEALW